MKSVNDFKFENVYPKSDPEFEEELIAFWAKNEVLDDALRKHRVKQVVCVIRDKQNKIVGVSTAAKVIHKPIKSYVYLYRCFIENSSRTAGLDTMLTAKTKGFLESIYKNETPTAVGFLIVVQTEFLKQWNKAVWPGLDMMYIGNTESGDPIRIYYFKGVRVGGGEY